ncbi:hypothetical protein CLOBOL_05350 [Enterocloster bolteae ATCC BAA-613]|uniref:Uncharacterized protein n=1 Tax=Enterocloster bolteae (strain ATCC BAA-613 / DSM 15670 / CCUG 46953 / JCM 12243 / WAL 16351) TaxID=411902 RepID=A8RZ81_ENTBW|nr:hypothetical protein CLOBOL_05350 [Enterocloster bolteae ATCC BAA-613]
MIQDPAFLCFLQLIYPSEYLNACYIEIKIFFILEIILKNISNVIYL